MLDRFKVGFRPSGKDVILIISCITLTITLTIGLYPTRLFQYMIAVKDEPELCMLYEKTVEENIIESERNHNE